MIKIEKTYGLQDVENDMTLIRLQELIVGAKKQYGWVGKAVIDTEKITYYKFGLKLGISRHVTNGLLVDEMGVIRYVGNFVPMIEDREVLTNIYVLFNKKCHF